MSDLERIIAEMREWRSGRDNAPPPCVTDWADRLAVIVETDRALLAAESGLAALAGAAPDVSPEELMLCNEAARFCDEHGLGIRAHAVRKLAAAASHAPAKAREVTEADVERAMEASGAEIDRLNEAEELSLMDRLRSGMH